MKNYRKILKEKRGQLKVAAIIVFLLLIPLVIGVAYNTNSDITGASIVTNKSIEALTTSTTSLELPQTTTSTTTDSTIFESTVNVNEMLSTTTTQENNLLETENMSQSQLTATSSSTTSTTSSTTIPKNGTVENSTNISTITSSSTTTTHPTVTTVITPAPEPEPKIELKLEIPEKITRGEKTELRAIATNVGRKETKLTLRWNLPPGFITDETIKNCGVLLPNSSCISEIPVETILSSETGKNEIEVEAIYD